MKVTPREDNQLSKVTSMKSLPSHEPPATDLAAQFAQEERDRKIHYRDMFLYRFNDSENEQVEAFKASVRTQEEFIKDS